MNRRSLITGAIALIAMPAVVRVSALAHVPGNLYELWDWKSPILPALPIFDNDPPFSMEGYLGPNGRLYEGTWTFFSKKAKHSIYDQQVSFSKQEYAA